MLQEAVALTQSVLMLINLGGDTIGQANDQLYTPLGLLLSAAESENPIIYVALNYRLSIWGFAVSDTLSQEGNTNLGLRDQRLALEWVQQNIAYFGGDPENVTIFGESDGATGVGLQCTAYGGSNGPAPFKRAIMESGSPAADPEMASNFSAINTANIAKVLNCPDPNTPEGLQCLRNVPYEDLYNITIPLTIQASPSAGFDVFVPHPDNDFVPGLPSDLLRTGQFYHEVDLILGWNLNDASVFTPPYITDQNLTQWLASPSSGVYFSNNTIDQALEFYAADQFPTQPGSDATGAVCVPISTTACSENKLC